MHPGSVLLMNYVVQDIELFKPKVGGLADNFPVYSITYFTLSFLGASFDFKNHTI